MSSWICWRADVAGHDDDGVLEIDRAALAVGQPAVVEHLQQHVEHVAVRLFDFVEEDHAVRAAAHGFGQSAALFVADVSRRRADQARDGVLLHELAHVDAHHRVLVVEQELGQRLAQLGLADAGGAEEQERADRPIRIAQARRGCGARHSETASTASSWPITRLPSRSSMCISFSRSPSSIRVTGTPVQRLTTSAISSGVTSSFTSALPSLVSSCKLLLGLLELACEDRASRRTGFARRLPVPLPLRLFQLDLLARRSAPAAS